MCRAIKRQGVKEIEEECEREIQGEAVGDCFIRALTGVVTHPVSGMYTLQLVRSREGVIVE